MCLAVPGKILAIDGNDPSSIRDELGDLLKYPCQVLFYQLGINDVY